VNHTAVIVATSEFGEEAESFLDYLCSPACSDLFKRHGLAPVGG